MVNRIRRNPKQQKGIVNESLKRFYNGTESYSKDDAMTAVDMSDRESTMTTHMALP